MRLLYPTCFALVGGRFSSQEGGYALASNYSFEPTFISHAVSHR